MPNATQDDNTPAPEDLHGKSPYEKGSVEDRIFRMAQVCVPEQDVAYVMGMKITDMGEKYQEIYQRGKAEARHRLRKKQWDLALDGKGDKTMLIWLGKQELGQTDRVVSETKTETTMVVKLTDGINADEVTGAEVIAIEQGSKA